MDLPEPNQLSQVMSQATAPAFVLGAVAGFTSILLGRMASIIERVRDLNDIHDGDKARDHLKADIPRLRARARLLVSATRLALASGMCYITFDCGVCERVPEITARIRCRNSFCFGCRIAWRIAF